MEPKQVFKKLRQIEPKHYKDISLIGGLVVDGHYHVKGCGALKRRSALGWRAAGDSKVLPAVLKEPGKNLCRECLPLILTEGRVGRKDAYLEDVLKEQEYLTSNFRIKLKPISELGSFEDHLDEIKRLDVFNYTQVRLNSADEEIGALTPHKGQVQQARIIRSMVKKFPESTLNYLSGSTLAAHSDREGKRLLFVRKPREKGDVKSSHFYKTLEIYLESLTHESDLYQVGTVLGEVLEENDLIVTRTTIPAPLNAEELFDLRGLFKIHKDLNARALIKDAYRTLQGLN